MRIKSLSSALVVLVAGAATHARASCPTPTFAQCVDTTYRNSACFSTHQSLCGDLINTEWRKQVGALPQRVRLMPAELGGGLKQVGVAPTPVPKGSNVTGYLGSVGGLVAANQILHRKNFQNLGPAELAHFNAMNAWKNNGTAIESCREFVYEKYQDYSVFEAAAGKHAADSRAIFTDAYGKDGLANRKLLSSSGKPLAPIFDGVSKAEKNAYYLFQPGPYPAGQQPYAFTAAAAQKANNAQGRQYFTPTDAWHTQMSQQLANINDDLLEVSRQKQQKFLELLAQRNTVMKQYHAFDNQTTKPKNLAGDVAALLRVIDQALEKALIEADAEGCLTLNKVTACDWSPRRYLDMVRGVMDARRQPELTACIKLTADDFSPTSFIKNAKALKIPGLTLNDYTLNPELVTTYLDIYGTAVPAILQMFEGHWGDGGEEGDRSTFAGAVTYGGGWDAQFDDEGPFCATEAGIEAFLTTSAWVFGEGGEIAAAAARLETNDENIDLTVDVRVFGHEIPMHWSEEAMLDFQVADLHIPEDEARISAMAPFFIGPIPVTISGGIEVNLGIEFRLGGQVWRECDIDAVGIDLTGTVKPYVGLNATASLALGIPGLMAGLRGRVNVSTVSMPITGSLGVNVNGADEVSLRVGLAVVINQRYLDGRITFFGELGACPAPFPACFSGEWTLVSWRGFGGEDIALYDQHLDTVIGHL
jgi:hypothetical protein